MTSPKTRRDEGMESAIATALSVAAGLFIVGQTVLVLLAPLSRATTADAIHNGLIFLSPDSYGYLRNGATWAGVGSETWNRWGFLTVIRVGQYLGSGAIFLVLTQALLLIGAGAALYDLGKRHSGAFAGFVAASVLLVNPMVSQWARFVHTEAIFYSFVVLSVWVAERVLAERGGEIWLVALAIGITTIRPNGILVGAACLTAVILARFRSRLRAVLVLLTWSAALGALVLGLNDATPRYGWDTATYTVEGVVIEGSEHARTSIAMPPPRVPITSNRDLLGYAAEHPLAVSRLALLRIWTETIQVRTHYPTVVNFAVGFFMLAYLGAALVGLVVLSSVRLTKIAILIALPLVLLIGATFAVPEGRFGWAYLVVFAVHVGVGASRLLEVGREFTHRAGR